MFRRIVSKPSGLLYSATAMLNSYQKGDSTMATTTEEILRYEEQFLDAKRALDLEVLDRLYADELLLTGALGEPTCGKTAIFEEVKRGIAEREKAIANGLQVEMSAVNEDIKV